MKAVCTVDAIDPCSLEAIDHCISCFGLFIEASCCRECRKTVHLVCNKCDAKTLDGIHEWCYCQLELLTTPTIWYRKRDE